MSTDISVRYHKPVLGVAAFSGTGKTTLLTQLIPLLKLRGVRVAVIKHAHHSVDIDNPEKDSYKVRQAGANPVILTSQSRTAIMLEHDIEQLPSLNELLDYLNPERIDLVLVEGFKEIEINKLFLFRKQIKNKILELDTTISRLMNEPHTLAVVTDLSAEEITPHLQTEKPILNINEVSSIADFIQHYIKTEAQHD